MSANPKRFQVALAAVLAVVFLAVAGNTLYSLTARTTAPPPPPPAAGRSRAPEATVAAAPAGERHDRVWPTFELAKITAYDPFALPGNGLPEEADPAASAAAGPTNLAAGGALNGSPGELPGGEKAHPLTGRIKAVYRRGDRAAAIIDSRTVHPGDTLDGAGHILDVDHRGVTVQLHP
jgi:hypothetical protein